MLIYSGSQGDAQKDFNKKPNLLFCLWSLTKAFAMIFIYLSSQNFQLNDFVIKSLEENRKKLLTMMNFFLIKFFPTIKSQRYHSLVNHLAFPIKIPSTPAAFFHHVFEGENISINYWSWRFQCLGEKKKTIKFILMTAFLRRNEFYATLLMSRKS